MKTAKGHNYTNLLNITVTDTSLTVRKGLSQLPFEVTPDYITKMVPVITARIQEGVKPAGTLQKQLERIELHREQLLDALEELFRCYRQMTEPQTRTSPIDKARCDMLTAIPDMKLLRMMCAMHLPEADDFVLPDDRKALITATVAAMRLADGLGKQNTP